MISSAIDMQDAAANTDMSGGIVKKGFESLPMENSNETISSVVKEEGTNASKLAVSVVPSSKFSLPVHHATRRRDKHSAYIETLRVLQDLTQSPPPGSIICPSVDLTPIYDKIVHSANETEKLSAIRRKIPRIIHFSFNDRCVPNELAESIRRWQEVLPDHTIFFHDDQAVRRLIGVENRNSQLWHLSKDFPELRRSLRCVKFKGAMLIDVWRMLVVWTFGGIYTDIDNWPGPKFNVTTIRDKDSFFSLSDSKDRPSQYLFGMTAGHPIAIFTLQDISRRIQKMKNIARPRVVRITGPQPMKFAFRKFNLLLEQNSTIFGKSSFFTQYQKITRVESDQYAKGNLGGTFDEIVDQYFDKISNTTYKNITKRTKTEILSGIKHWTEDVKLGQKKENTTEKEFTQDSNPGIQMNVTNPEHRAGKPISYDGLSCMNYLATLDRRIVL
eukprot:CAMPEP_0197191386 /NCGR_PEP_ID=MMETSP1423-20130617/23298_1 /TAXON_ID=476441 /ORGANISM="Pseudo-nitzschia heimii, Strain UNC1101" /LENGTH=442 /DNA_ID=CAMNT_0042644005 /DNA_START=312 /DNA_END=1640 /DNA_ORIENTATION=-